MRDSADDESDLSDVPDMDDVDSSTIFPNLVQREGEGPSSSANGGENEAEEGQGKEDSSPTNKE